jgi:hypothetical protein
MYLTGLIFVALELLLVTDREYGGTKEQCMVPTLKSVLQPRSLPKIVMSR